MKKLLALLVVGGLLGLTTGCPGPSTKPNPNPRGGPSDKEGAATGVRKDKFIGKWKVVKNESGDMPPDAAFEFAKDGTVTMTGKGPKGKPLSVKGTYTLDGNKFTAAMKAGGKDFQVTGTITKLTDEEMVVQDAKGKSDTYQKQ